MSSGRRGKDAAAHSELNGGLGVLGEELVMTGGRRRSRWPWVEDDDVDGVPGHPALHDSMHRMSASLRSSGTRPWGEGTTVDVSSGVGGSRPRLGTRGREGCMLFL